MIPSIPNAKAAVYPKDSKTVRKMQKLAADSLTCLSSVIRDQPLKQPPRIMLKINQSMHKTAWHRR